MSENHDLTTAVYDVLALLDETEYPWIYGYLSSLTGDDGEVTASPYTIATTLLAQREPSYFPAILLDFIVELLQMEIEGGNDDAMNTLGALYYDGKRGFEQSYEQAIRCYTMASELGNQLATENLGYCYYYGRAGEPDYEKAFHCFAQGAFAGQLVSLYKIGDMYRGGLYVRKNEVEAFRIYMRCVNSMEQQDELRVAGPVYLRLGWMFLEGKGTPQDFKGALASFQRAEWFLYEMVESGETMYRKSLADAIRGQEMARRKLGELLPPEPWEYAGE